MACPALCPNSLSCHVQTCADISILHLNPSQHTPVVQNRLIKAGCDPFSYTISGLSSVMEIWNQDRICKSIPFHVLGWFWPCMKTIVYRIWQLPPEPGTVSQKLSQKKLAKYILLNKVTKFPFLYETLWQKWRMVTSRLSPITGSSSCCSQVPPVFTESYQILGIEMTI